MAIQSPGTIAANERTLRQIKEVTKDGASSIDGLCVLVGQGPACDAARKIAKKRMPLDPPPTLPLPNCDAERCMCMVSPHFTFDPE